MKRTPHTYECHITHPVPRFRSFFTRPSTGQGDTPDRRITLLPKGIQNPWTILGVGSGCSFPGLQTAPDRWNSAGLASNARPSPRIHTPLQVLCNSSVHQNIDRTPEVCCTKSHAAPSWDHGGSPYTNSTSYSENALNAYQLSSFDHPPPLQGPGPVVGET